MRDASRRVVPGMATNPSIAYQTSARCHARAENLFRSPYADSKSERLPQLDQALVTLPILFSPSRVTQS